ncbi:MAG: SDR family oxidoreductase [Henriciella sp.]
MADKVFVLGASGDQGVPLVTALLGAGFDVTAGVRRPDALFATPFPDLPTQPADILDQASLEAAFAGHTALAMHLPFEHDPEIAAAYGRNIANAAKVAGLEKIVFNSSCYVADSDLGMGGHDGRRRIQSFIEKSGVNYVFIEPVVFMNNMIAPWCKPSIVNHSVFAYPAAPDLKISVISLDDVAHAMAAALKTDAVDRQHIPIGGPEALTGFEIAQRLSAAAGREIQFRSLSPEEFAANISELVTGKREVPPGSVYDGMAQFYRFYNEQPVSPLAVRPEDWTDKLPIKLTSLETWAQQQDWTA